MGKVKKCRVRADTSTKARKSAVKKTLKARVRFVFLGLDGCKYTNQNSRLKVNQDGATTCHIQNEEKKWIGVKGSISSVKIFMEKPIVYEK